ncbi:MAG TPA: TIGR02099 family protein [Coxiellaceae bacterium]|nr:TIGR02099 family protein [Coxiellaceae bacterium]
MKVSRLPRVMLRLWYAFAFTLAFLALIATLTRILTPRLNVYKPALEKIASQALKRPIHVDRLRFSWAGIYPQVILVHVQIFDPKKPQSVQLSIREVRANIDLFHSLLSRQWTLHEIAIRETHIEVHSSAKSGININGFFIDTSHHELQPASDFDYQHVISRLLQQHKLSVSDVTIDWYRDQQFIPLTLQQLVLVNTWNDHVLYGAISTTLRQTPTSLVFSLTMTGDIFNDPADLRASFYAHVNHLAVSEWDYHPVIFGYELMQGTLDGSVWAQWENGRVDLIQSLLTLSDLRLFSSAVHKMLPIDKLSGNFLWKPEAQGWSVSGDRIQIMAGHDTWPDNAFYLHMGLNGAEPQQTVWVKNIHLENLNRLLQGSSLFDDAWMKSLAKIQPNGELNDFYLQHNGDIQTFKQYIIATSVDHVSCQRFENIPGFQNFSGVLQLTPESGELDMDSQNLQLDFGDLFQNPLAITQLQGVFSWYQNQDKSWTVQGKNLLVINPAVAGYGEMGLLIPSDGHNPFVGVQVGFTVNDSSQVAHYFPSGILHKSIIDWLDQAFVSGKGAAGTFVLRGNMADFPFDHNEGVFIIDSDVAPTTLHFAPDWPNVENASGELIFSGRSMHFDGTGGQIENAQIRQVTAAIPEMGTPNETLLVIQGSVDGGAGDMLRFLQESPLKSMIGAGVDRFTAQGNAHLDLDLSLPLEKPEGVKLQGGLNLSDVSLGIPDWALQFDHIQGPVKFSETQLAASKLTAQLMQKPIILNLQALKTDSGVPFTRLDFKSDVTIAEIEHYFHVFLSRFITGQTAYAATIDLHTARHDRQQSQIMIQAPMTDIATSLPIPFKKLSGTTLPTEAYFNFGADRPFQITMYAGDQLSGAMQFDKDQWRRANLHFGDRQARIPNAAGLLIDGKLPTFDWTTWRDYFNTLPISSTQIGSNSTTQIRHILNQIHLSIGQIDLLGQTLKNTLFQIKPAQDHWAISINSSDNEGSLTIPYDFSPESVITAQFNKLTLRDDAGHQQAMTVAPQQIPALNISVSRFQYNNKRINNIQLITSPERSGMQIEQLNLNSDLLQGAMTGRWRQTKAGENTTTLSGTISSADFTQLLKSFQMVTSIRPGKGQIIFDLTWPDRLDQFDLARTNGQIKLNFKSGRIVDIGDSAVAKLDIGRLLTLLSVNRLLQFNFKDFTNQGYNFNQLTGDLVLKNGIITTEDLSFLGETADLNFEGSINVISKTLDLDLAITPHVTSSLPIVAAFAVNPIAGAATWAASKIMSGVVDEVTTYHYHVTGSWTSPNIQAEHSALITSPLNLVSKPVEYVKQLVT